MASLVLMLLVLVVLAILQYRWIGEVSQAEHARLRWALDNAVSQFRVEFNAELRHLGAAFQVPPYSSDVALRRQLEDRFADWKAEGHLSGLLAGLCVRTKQSGGTPTLMRFNPAKGDWEPSPWPLGFDRVRGPAWNVWSNAESTSPRAMDWRFFPGAPALARPIRQVDGAAGDSDFIVLELDTAYVSGTFLPSLARKHFGTQKDPVFDVAVMFAGESESPIYSSSSGSTTDWFAKPDSRWPLVRDRFDPGFRPPEAPGGKPSDGYAARPAGSPPLESPTPSFARGTWRVPGMLTSEGRGWDLLVRYRVGSLEEAVRRSRLRNLILGFGVLLLLAAGMSFLLIAARRAQRLAQLQVRFVAGVSHDLRTPLAVINSAADNLAAGAVGDAGPKSRQYGSLIRGECQKLAAMVEEILDYAGQRGLVRSLSLQPMFIDGIIRDALAEASPLLEAGKFKIETAIPPDLPPVIANRSAFLQVLRNILENAIRHAAAARWVRIGAGTVQADGKPYVEVRIEDRGPGIDSADLPHIFKPFYRGRNAESADTRGSGLGLHLAYERVVAMGGSIHAESGPRGGTAFVVRLLPGSDEESASMSVRKEEGIV
jgi:signal transduction histidine kinase